MRLPNKKQKKNEMATLSKSVKINSGYKNQTNARGDKSDGIGLKNGEA